MKTKTKSKTGPELDALLDDFFDRTLKKIICELKERTLREHDLRVRKRYKELGLAWRGIKSKS